MDEQENLNMEEQLSDSQAEETVVPPEAGTEIDQLKKELQEQKE